MDIEIKYDAIRRYGTFHLHNKVTIIQDDSGTGKSTWVRDLRMDTTTVNITEGFRLVELPLAFPTKYSYTAFIDYFKLASQDSTPIFYADEGIPYLRLRSFQAAVNEFAALFVFINRYKFSSMSYGVNSFYRIIYEKQSDEKYASSLKILYDLSGVLGNIDKLLYVVPEDAESGRDLYKQYGGFNIGSAEGKDKIPSLILDTRDTLFIADSVGFGSNIEDALNNLELNPQNNNALLMIPSFEGMLLKSKFLRQDTELCRQAYAKALEKWSKTSSNGALCVVSNYEDLYTTFLKELLRLYDISHNWKKGNTPKCLLDECCWRPKECIWKMDGNKCELLLDKVLCKCLKRIKYNRIRNQIPDSLEGAADTTSMFQNRGELPASK